MRQAMPAAPGTHKKNIKIEGLKYRRVSESKGRSAPAGSFWGAGGLTSLIRVLGRESQPQRTRSVE